VVLLLLTACKAVDPAPAGFDELVHTSFWLQADGTDAELAETLDELHEVIDGDKLEEGFDGSLASLPRDHAELVGIHDRDPADATGIFMARPLACDLDRLAEVVTSTGQMETHPGVYDSYQRTFLGSRDDFLAGSIDRLEWDTSYETTIVGISYGVDVRGGIRRLTEGSDRVPALVTRLHMPEPADFDNDKKSLEQDYQLEWFWERKPGELLHIYAVWRQVDFGAGLTDDDEGIQRILLNNMDDWDDEIEAACEP